MSMNSAAVRADGDYVLYWMIAFRRTEWNFSLQRAVEWAVELQKPLLIFEPLRSGYRWASDRLHRFVIDGMADNASRIASLNHPGVHYFPWVEREPDEGKGLLMALAERACVVVTDDFPSFFLPRMVASAASVCPVYFEQVDSNGLLPLYCTERAFTTAHSFRAFLQTELPKHLNQFPRHDPLRKLRLPPMTRLPSQITRRWPAVSPNLLAGSPAELAKLPIDHTVGVTNLKGGREAARSRLHDFLEQRLALYAAGANEPDEDSRSGLSPALHFGQIAPQELFLSVVQQEEWTPEQLGSSTGGRREGWWGMSAAAESWLDELITWRELGYNLTSHTADYDRYESLPAWSRATLEKHAADRRQFIYSLEEFTAATTHDPLWNAAQRQLVREGRIHNYLRMLWGKKILEWTASPRDALEIMIELNNRFALDGRNPNSFSGIFWVLGRYDRAWGPERPIFGTVRYMSSDSTRRKLRVRQYLQRYGGTGELP